MFQLLLGASIGNNLNNNKHPLIIFVIDLRFTYMHLLKCLHPLSPTHLKLITPFGWSVKALFILILRRMMQR